MKSTKFLLFLSVLITLVFVGGFIFEIINIRSSREEVAELESQAGNGSAGDSFTQALRNIQNNNKEELALLSNLFVTKDSLVDFLEVVESTGRGLGLKVKNNSIQGNSKVVGLPPGVSTVNIVISTEGEWAGSVAFLRFLEALPYKVVVTDAQLSASSEDEAHKAIWTGHYTLTLYSKGA